MKDGDDQYSKGQLSQEIASDLALLLSSEFRIGNAPIREVNPENARPFWVRYMVDGMIHNRAYRSGVTWRRRVTYSLKEGVPLQVLEMDEWGRLKAMFSKEVLTRLAWNAAKPCDPLPVARFFDPNGDAEILLVRSRCQGHAVDVVHNLTDGGLVQQPLWIADIMRLHPLLGIKLVRDGTFNPTTLISGHFGGVRT